MTIASIISILNSIASAIVGFLNWLHDRKLVQAGIAQQKLEDLKGQIHDTQIAIAAREAVRADIIANGGKLPEHDPFLRD